MRGEALVLAGGEGGGEVVGADGEAVEGGDADLETQEHAFDLVVEAFINGEVEGGGGERLDDGGLGAGLFLVEGHAATEFFDKLRWDDLIGGNVVAFGCFFLGAGERFGEAGVVGEDDEAGGGAVESPGEMEFVGPWFVDEVDDGAVFGVGGGANDSGGFVEE